MCPPKFVPAHHVGQFHDVPALTNVLPGWTGRAALKCSALNVWSGAPSGHIICFYFIYDFFVKKKIIILIKMSCGKYKWKALWKCKRMVFMLCWYLRLLNYPSFNLHLGTKNLLRAHEIPICAPAGHIKFFWMWICGIKRHHHNRPWTVVVQQNYFQQSVGIHYAVDDGKWF